jgi:hypothetical protein
MALVPAPPPSAEPLLAEFTKFLQACLVAWSTGGQSELGAWRLYQ